MKCCSRIHKLKDLLKDEDAYWLCGHAQFISSTWFKLITKQEVENEQINRAFWLAWFEFKKNPVYQKFPTEIDAVIQQIMTTLMEAANDQDLRDRAVVKESVIYFVSYVVYLLHGYRSMRKAAEVLRTEIIYEELHEDLLQISDRYSHL